MVDHLLGRIHGSFGGYRDMRRQSAISFLGIVALLSPLFLWMTWSPLSFRLVLYGGVSAVLLIYLLIWSSPDDFL